MTAPFLCTTALSEFWDFNAKKILFLGQWCLRYDRQSEWENLDYEVLPYLWDDRDAMHRAAEYEKKVYEALLHAVSDLMNAVHREYHGDRYWRMILGPWLLHYVQVMHERFMCLRTAFERYHECRTIGLSEQSFRIPRDFEDYILGSIADPYNLQLYTSLLKAMGMDVHLRDYHWEWDGFTKKSSLLGGLMEIAGSLKKKMSCRWAMNKEILMVDMYMPRKKFAEFLLVAEAKAGVATLPSTRHWTNDYQETHRHRCRDEFALLRPAMDDSFLSVLVRTLPHNLPLIYLEGYHSCREWIQKEWGQSKTRVILTANALEMNDTFKFLAADSVEKGVKMIAIQHGGSYGTARYNPNEELESTVSDEFWSWGWRDTKGKNRPMPSPKLSHINAMSAKSVRGNRYIYYVANIIPRFHYRTWSCPTAGQGLQYLNWQITFIMTLRQDVRARLIYRPYQKDYGWNVKKRLVDACSELQIEDPLGDYFDKLKNATLVVCDMNQSSLLECLAANIPVVAFWDPQHWELRQSAEPYYRFLREVKILHNSPQDAACHSNALWPDVASWWLDQGVQKARMAFTEQFAYHSPDWASVWYKHLQYIMTN